MFEQKYILFISFTLGYIVCSSLGTPDAQVLLGSRHPSRRGICAVEVPTVDLVPPDQPGIAVTQQSGVQMGYTRIEVCCLGYIRKPLRDLECEPLCDRGCNNGICVRPNVCECHHGFIRINNKCVQGCPAGCLHGTCTGYDKSFCTCNTGYMLSDDSTHCIPYCDGGCGVGGQCTAPNVCTCKRGFTLDQQTNKCGYHCDGGCIGGTCTGPNRCSCERGYQLVNNRCEPICPNGCRNGRCVAPNRCACESDSAWDSATNACISRYTNYPNTNYPNTNHPTTNYPNTNYPNTGNVAGLCSQPCLNADCVGPDTCVCKHGYEFPPGNRYKCVASCPGGCVNGVCASPNFCVCNPGYFKEYKGSNTCIRR